ncbi:MAG TPA: peptidylprolyl isomerase [Chitinophagales bacterium]|nr:peptidylprolyl isomerase [Chitinophagales bacterium]HNL85045.1 peptidylprolyl isomerase [Chitinophagales bacterium]
MLLIMKDSVVSVDYELKVDDGNGNLITADKSQPGQPLVYLHGSGQLLAEFEKNLLGKTAGDTVSFTVSAENGYGTRRDEDIVEIPVDSFKGQDGNLDTTVVKVGNVLPMMDNQGNQFQGIVVDVNDQFVVMDFNHPMAGKELNFTVTVLNVRPATAEELAHGHVHGEGGHHH